MMFLPRKENSSACGRVQCNPIQVCFFFFFLPFSVQSARKLSNARVLLTQRSQEVNYSRLRRHHGGGGEKKKKQHTGRLDPIMAAVKTCWSLFFWRPLEQSGGWGEGCVGGQSTKGFLRNYVVYLKVAFVFIPDFAWADHQERCCCCSCCCCGRPSHKHADTIAAVMYLFLWKLARCH